MPESSARLTIASVITLLTAVCLMGVWAGSLGAEVQETRAEYGAVLREVREMRQELHQFQLQQARLHGLQAER